MNNDTKTNKKRKRNVLSVAVKLQIVKQHSSGHSVSSLAQEYDVGIQTIRDIIKNKQKLEQFISKSDSSKCLSERKSIKGSAFKELDDAMTKWFIQKRAEGVPISGPMCLRQAQNFHTQLQIKENFNASNGWLYRFKKRHGIRELSIQGEKLSADECAMVEFCYELESVIKEHSLRPAQIYNADETGVYWKSMPTRTLASENEKSAPGYKIKKDRLTVLCCANASGEHKMKLTVIGKSKSPRAFKNMNKNMLPVHYYHQSAAWMNRDIFRDWFFSKFIPEVRVFLRENNLPQKALLLLDNAPSHPNEAILKSQDGNIFVMFLPPNVTSVAQPMDQGVIETMKRLYRKDLMMNLLLEKVDMLMFWKTLTIKDAIFALARSWEGVKESTIRRAFFKIMTLEDETEECDSESEDLSSSHLAEVAQSVGQLCGIGEREIDQWILCDSDDPGYQVLTDQQLVSEILDQPSTSTATSLQHGDEDLSSDDEVSASHVSHQQAAAAADVLLDYFEQQEDGELIDILNLRKLRQQIKINSRKAQKQTKVTDYFKNVHT